MSSEARLAQLQEMLADDPESDFLRYGVAMQLKGLGRLPEAIAAFESMQEQHPQYLATYYQFASTLASAGEDARALATAKRGAELAGELGEAHAKAELEDLIDELAG